MEIKTRKTLGRSLAAFVGAAALATLGAAPAQASTDCVIGSSGFCMTGVTPANSTYHSVVLGAKPGLGSVTCVAYDNRTYERVGSVTATSWSGEKKKTIGGLYGLYYAICTQTSGSGGGGSIG